MDLDGGNSISRQKDFQIPVIPVKPIIQRPQPNRGVNNWEAAALAGRNPVSGNNARKCTDRTFSPQMTHCELPIPSRQTFDLNVLPGTIADELPSSTIPQFPHISPPDKRTNQENQNNNEVATTRIEIIELHQEKTLSHADSSFPAVSTAVAANHTPEKESDQVIDLNMTPEEIEEGKPKRTQKPAVPKPDDSKENHTGKRKYLQKKGLDKLSMATTSEVAGQISDPKPVETMGKSAKRLGQCNDLHSYGALQVKDFTNRISGMYFPEICKKRRTEKGQTSTTSTTSSSVTTAKDVVQLVRQRLQNHTNASLLESKANCWIPPLQLQKNRTPTTKAEGVRVAIDREEAFRCMLALGHKERLTKGLDKSSTTTPPEVAGEISDPKPIETMRKSARRLLNFELDGQGKNESAVCKSANVNPESQEQQFCNGKVQSKAIVQICQGMEVLTVGNTGAGIAYDLGNKHLKDYISLPTRQITGAGLVYDLGNKHLKDYISLPKRQTPSTPPSSNTNLPHEKLTANAQSENYEEIGQVTADDKLGSEQIILKTNKHVASSLNYSSYSTTASLVDRQATAKKRLGAHILDMEHTSTANPSGGQFNDLHSYGALQAEDFTNRISGMYFPEICKKRRTEKGQTSTTSTTSSSVTTAKDAVQLVRQRLQNYTNASLLESKANCCIPPPQLQTSRTPTTEAEGVRVAIDREEAFRCMLALGHKERLTKGLDKSSTTTPTEVAGEISDPKPVETMRKSARRLLNFELDEQGKNESAVCKSANVNPESQEQQFCNGKVQSKAIVQICQRMEVLTLGNTGAGIAYDLGNKHLKDYISLLKRQTPSTPPSSNTNLPHEKLTANAQSENYEERGQVTADDKLGSEQIILKTNKHLASSLNYSSRSTTASLVDRQATAKKRLGAHILDMEHTSTVNPSGGQFNDLHSYKALQVEGFSNGICGLYFPEICKKRRTEKGQTSTTSSTSPSVTTAKDVVQLARQRLQNHTNASLLESKANCWIPPPQLQTNRTPTTEAEAARVAMDREKGFQCMLALGQKERFTKKRSKGPTRVRDLASLMGIAERKLLPTLLAKQAVLKAEGGEVSHGPQNCIEALFYKNAGLACKAISSTFLDENGARYRQIFQQSYSNREGL